MSLQAKLIGDDLFPGLYKRIYIKNYRYNMHFKERCMLIELGTNNNTVQDAYNAIPYLATTLDMLLSGTAIIQEN